MKVVVDNSNLLDADINPAEMEELRSGFDDWMRSLGEIPRGGFRVGDVAVVAAGVGVGKSVFDTKDDGQD